jgi:uncharacterized membrane protein
MAGPRKQILDWARQGCLPAGALPEALRIGGAEPSPDDWRRFLDRLALWLGAVFLAAAVIFFMAYNWLALGRFAKFGLVEAGIAAAVGLCWRMGVDRTAGKAALLTAALLAGSLLALVGQTYQTGADPWELFAFWALAIFPWAAAGRFGALWLFWIGLLNLAAVLYHQAFGGLFGALLGDETLWWVLFGLDSLALGAWELAASVTGAAWLSERWPPRVLAVASGGLITALALEGILGSRASDPAAVLGYCAWLAAAYLAYRYWKPDLFVLSGGVLSAIIVVACLLAKGLMDRFEAGGLLFIGLVVIGLSALAGYWLKAVSAEVRS